MISWNEIKSRAMAFAREWADVSSEDAEAKTFWNEFFHIFNIPRRRVATFEQRVKKIDGRDGYIDLLWKGTLLIEHKSRGKNLDRAHQQALEYFPGLKDRELPQYIMVSDFARFRLYNLEDGTRHEFALQDLHKHVHLFGFIAGYQVHAIREEDPVNIKAAERMGRLHDQLKDVGYTGHALEVYLVRLLFCMFADDTGIFQRQEFQEYLEQRTHEDGSDLGHHLATFFHVLNTPHDHRLKNLDEQLAAFPFINGKLFAESLPPASFDAAMRQSLLDCCGLDWSRISPAIFGSLFQSIMDKAARRNLGAHYTSEKNILKLIKPLFLDALWQQFEKIKHNDKKLGEFHQYLRTLTFLDPACGCGNFLVIAYRELRLLELAVLRLLNPDGQQIIDVQKFVLLDIDQFYGIEIEEFPAQIAQVALWLMDHQMNLKVSEEFGRYFARIPLKTSATIVCENALRLDWNDIVPADRLSYIMGNPPFIGHHLQDKEQKKELRDVLNGIKAAGVMDYVSAWYVKGLEYIQKTHIKIAYVSTNSIAQGEQVGILWRHLFDRYQVKIHFAHRTFKWSNEAKGVAAVYCVIIGFAAFDVNDKSIYHYEDIKGEPFKIKAKNINPYLLDATDILLKNRSKPICNVPAMKYGSKPTDGGNFLLTDEEKEAFLIKEPKAEKYVHPFISAREFLHNKKRWCLWLVDAEPAELRQMPEIIKRVEAVKQFRAKSIAKSTREYPFHTLFRQVTQPISDYILVPSTTSENRRYIPIGFLSKNIILSNASFAIPNAGLYHFGILESEMHMAWVRYVCGRLKSDFRYSKDIVYNNYPWPENPSDKQKQAVEAAARAVLDAREAFPDACLADLYDPLTMPQVLLKAHQQLDKAVDAAYGKKSFATEADRVAFLFDLYGKYISQT